MVGRKKLTTVAGVGEGGEAAESGQRSAIRGQEEGGQKGKKRGWKPRPLYEDATPERSGAAFCV